MREASAYLVLEHELWYLACLVARTLGNILRDSKEDSLERGGRRRGDLDGVELGLDRLVLWVVGLELDDPVDGEGCLTLS